MRAVAIIVLVIICVVLGVGLIHVSRQAEKERAEQQKTVMDLSNSLAQASKSLEEARQSIIIIQTNLNTEEKKAAEVTQELKRKEGEVERLKIELVDAKKQAEINAELARKTEQQAAEKAREMQQEIAKHSEKIKELEAQNEQLTQQSTELSNKIAALEIKIKEAEQKLASAENDRDFLLAQIKRMQAEKAELERQFNDLKIVKAQVKKLTEEHHISLRRAWIAKGLYQDRKGAELLTMPPKPKTATNPPAGLEVELRTGGDATIKSGLPTNAPPKK